MNRDHSILFDALAVDLAHELPSGQVPTPEQALLCLRDHGRLALLHSAGGEPCRFSLLGFDPVVSFDGAPDVDSPQPTTFEELESQLQRLRTISEPPGPFQGGFLGAISYDFGAANLDLALPKNLAPDPFGQPQLVGGLFTDFVVWDHREKTCHLVINRARDDCKARRVRLMEALSQEGVGARRFDVSGEFSRAVSPSEHVRRVEAVRAAIRRGDLYQANLAHRIHGQVEGEAVDVYAALVEANHAPYMGFVGWPGGALMSASPELLLELEHNGHGELVATTRPIKGTIRRGVNHGEDLALVAELMGSAKDRAELAMIVDLERNDLGRVARVGSVEVGEFPRLETFASVHHLVADVRATLKDDVNAFELLASIFPGGSITGAPKLASMELIATLEGEQRGFFCGSLGFVDTRGEACFNILIRTLLWSEAVAGEVPVAAVSLRVGGGITWASEARDEDQETLHKAKSLLAALGVTGPG